MAFLLISCQISNFCQEPLKIPFVLFLNFHASLDLFCSNKYKPVENVFSTMHESDFTYHHLCEMWNLWMTIFLNYWDFECKNCRFHCDFSWNCWNYEKKGENRNSRPRTEVKHDSVKCWKSLLRVNFLWTWIHWPITKLKVISRNIFYVFVPLCICRNSSTSTSVN